MKQLTVRDLAHIAIVAALYVALTATPPLNAISYGGIQFRLSEMLNFLAFYNPKYIIAVTLGCMIANTFGTIGLLDVFVGGGSTLVFVTLGLILFSKYKKEYIFNGFFNKAFFYFSVFYAIFMVTIAAETSLVLQTPFLLTWLTVAVGELISSLFGALVIDKLAQYIDFTT
ncbi:citrulline cluster-linked protein [Streptococcus troglodytae]|uniref:Citrulline cluster-linked protein n=1 Tax=Streptococcus troglodytae TaxID=1111760 RepID=A0A1L7LHZ0_9STRE|nr:QueT transporter family protein [Streptococcus troglodytae]BAQ23834.1 citrulline cluster-linked protein [Streptococcus troglodytae]